MSESKLAEALRSLLSRLRPDIECAPWVAKEITAMLAAHDARKGDGVSVPDSLPIPEHSDWSFQPDLASRQAYAKGWNACRDAALEAAGCGVDGWEHVVVDELPEGYSLGHNEKFAEEWWVLHNKRYAENKVYSTKDQAIAGAHRIEHLRLRRVLDDMNHLIERARALGGSHE